MGKVFGVKEARAASEFATSREQKLTVLAVVRMLGIPVTLKAQVKKQVDKITLANSVTANKIGKLESKTRSLQTVLGNKTTEKFELYGTAEDWAY